MKKAETILREEISKGYSKPITDEAWKELQEDLGYQAVLSAMKLYAEQAIDEVSEMAQCEDGAIVDMGFEIVAASVNKESILNVKNLLK